MGEGGVPRKFGWGCAARLWKPLLYFTPNSKFYTPFQTRPLPHFVCLNIWQPISDQNGQNLRSISEQNGSKTIPLGAAHTYMAYIREYPPQGHKTKITCTPNFRSLLFQTCTLYNEDKLASYLVRRFSLCLPWQLWQETIAGREGKIASDGHTM